MNIVLDKDFDFQSLKTTGIRINYLHVCDRKLWLFDRGIGMEQTSDKVLLGKLLGEYSYPRQQTKDILIDNLIRIDIMDKDTIREIKYSNKLQEADRAQILYYLYYLKRLGIEKKGIINYPKMRRREEVVLTEEAERGVEEDLRRVQEIISLKNPPQAKMKPYCKKCSYYEFCWV
jgi:CRISPR-associated exonuclease Cas4